MKRIIITICLIPMIHIAIAQTNSLDNLRTKYEEIQTQITEACQKQKADTLAAYNKALDNLMATLKKQGDIDTFILIEKEKKRFEVEKALPPSQGQHKYLLKLISTCNDALKKTDDESATKTANLKKQYIQKLEASIKQLMIADKIDEAKVVKSEIERVQSTMATPQQGVIPPSIGAKPQMPAVVEATPPAQTNDNENVAIVSDIKTLVSNAVCYISFDKDDYAKKHAREISSAKGDKIGKMVGGVSFGKGVKGEAATFDGTGMIDFTQSPPPLVGNPPFSILFYLKTKSNKGYILQQRKSDKGQFIVELSSSGGIVYWDTKAGDANCSKVKSQRTINDGKWHHVIVVRSTDTITVYIDGKLDISDVGKPLEVHQPFVIGSNTSKLHCYTGSIDELIFLDSALTETDITKLFKK